MEIILEYCDNRYYYKDLKGKKHVFRSIDDAERWLNFRDLVIVDVIKCKPKRSNDCCNSKFRGNL